MFKAEDNKHDSDISRSFEHMLANLPMLSLTIIFQLTTYSFIFKFVCTTVYTFEQGTSDSLHIPDGNVLFRKEFRIQIISINMS